jgi:putative membrane protein
MMLFAMYDTMQSFLVALVQSFAFGLLGVVLLLIAFKSFELMTPKVDLESELAKGNTAVGIVCGAMLVALSFIIMRVVG